MSPLGGATVEYPGLQLRKLSLQSRPREVSDAFLLSSATFFQFHSQTNVVTELCH